MQDAGGVGADLAPRADLAERRGLLVHVDVDAAAQQRQRRGEAADPTAHDADRDSISHDSLPWGSGDGTTRQPMAGIRMAGHSTGIQIYESAFGLAVRWAESLSVKYLSRGSAPTGVR